ncbi:MAG: hypothetical protein AAFX94_20545, partial [Myxococcota bacterium]
MVEDGVGLDVAAYSSELLVDPSGGRVFTLQRTNALALRSTSLETGERSEISNGNLGTGPVGFDPAGPFTMDVVTDRVFVAAPSLNALVAVDIRSGNRIIVSGPSTGTGPTITPGSSAFVGDSRVLVTDSSLDAVFSVDKGVWESCSDFVTMPAIAA